MDEDPNWELVQEPETLESRDMPQGSSENIPPRPPDKVALSPRPEDHQMEKSRRYHHDTKADSRRNTGGDAADPAEQGIERSRKHKGESQPQSRDDVEVGGAARSSSRARMEGELRLWRENDDLRHQLELERTRAEQAERAAEEMRAYARAKERELQDAMLAVANDSDAIGAEVSRLRKENQDLRAELDDARSHIFSLQPYRQELMPKEVARDFDDLVTSVSEWVQKFAEPIVDNEENLQHFLSRARKHPDDVTRLRRLAGNQPDLVYGCIYPEADVDILISTVLRYLNDNIFQKGVPGAVHHIGEVVSQIEGSMQAYVEPKRDQFAIRTWRAEAFSAILASPDYTVARKKRMKELVLDLVGGLKLFYREKDHSDFCYSAQDNVIKPALALHEKLLTSTHHFYLDINPYIVWNQNRDPEMSPDFLDNLDKLQCDNILQNRKRFDVTKLDPMPSREELRENLTNVLTVVPGLYMRQIGKGDAIKPPTVVRKQQVLVAYGPPEKKHKFIEKGQRTLMSYICSPPREKQDRSAENPWTAWRNISWG